MRRDQKGNAMIIVLCVLSVVIILGLSMAAISGSSRSATVKNQHNQQAYYTARSVLDGVVLMLQENGDADNIAKGLQDKPDAGAVLTAKGDLEGMGSYTVTMALTDDVEYITVLEPDLDAEGVQKTNEKGELLYKEKEVVSRLPLKITVQSQYKDSAAMVSAYIDGTPVLGDAPAGGTDADPEKPDKPEISGAVDPVIQGLFEHVLGIAGAIGNMKNVTITGDIYAGGSIGNLDGCTINGNMYTDSSIGWFNSSTKMTGDIYTGGSWPGYEHGDKLDGKYYSGVSSADLPTLGTLGNWPPASVTASALTKTINAKNGPVYLTTSANEISNLTIEGDYPVYIQVTGNSLDIATDGIKGAKETQVFYLCSDSVKNVTIGPGSSEGASTFYGYIYAPKAAISLHKNTTVVGALSASGITVDKKGNADNITLIYQAPVGNHPDETVPLPDGGDEGGSDGGNDGESGGGSGDNGDGETNPDDTKDKVVEKYQWPVTGYQGGAV